MINPSKYFKSPLLGVAVYMGGLALLFVGWVALLGFPWGWVVTAVAIIEVVLMAVVLGMEYASRNVSGAGGWMVFAFIMGHVWLFAGALVLRAAIWIFQAT
jgi:hypothetical protein